MTTGHCILQLHANTGPTWSAHATACYGYVLILDLHDHIVLLYVKGQKPLIVVSYCEVWLDFNIWWCPRQKLTFQLWISRNKACTVHHMQCNTTDYSILYFMIRKPEAFTVSEYRGPWFHFLGNNSAYSDCHFSPICIQPQKLLPTSDALSICLSSKNSTFHSKMVSPVKVPELLVFFFGSLLYYW